jgi:hypothetical protein
MQAWILPLSAWLLGEGLLAIKGVQKGIRNTEAQQAEDLRVRVALGGE